MIGRRRHDEWKQLFRKTACFLWSQGGQSWGQVLSGCESPQSPGTFLINPARSAPASNGQLAPGPAHPLGQREAPFPSLPLLFSFKESPGTICQTKGRRVMERTSSKDGNASLQPDHNIYGVKDSKNRTGKRARQGHPGEIRKWRKAEGLRSQIPAQCPWDSTCYLCSDFY